MRNMEQVALLFVIHAKEKKVRGQGSRGGMFWLVAPFWSKLAGWRESYASVSAPAAHVASSAGTKRGFRVRG